MIITHCIWECYWPCTHLLTAEAVTSIPQWTRHRFGCWATDVVLLTCMRKLCRVHKLVNLVFTFTFVIAKQSQVTQLFFVLSRHVFTMVLTWHYNIVTRVIHSDSSILLQNELRLLFHFHALGSPPNPTRFGHCFIPVIRSFRSCSNFAFFVPSAGLTYCQNSFIFVICKFQGPPLTSEAE